MFVEGEGPSSFSFFKEIEAFVLTLLEIQRQQAFDFVLMHIGRQRIHWSSRTTWRHWDRISRSQGKSLKLMLIFSCRPKYTRAVKSVDWSLIFTGGERPSGKTRSCWPCWVWRTRTTSKNKKLTYCH